MNDMHSHFKADSWRIVEISFDRSRCRFSESIFTLSNQRMGCRGNFEEGYSADCLEGSYFAGLFESIPLDHPWGPGPDFPNAEDFIVTAMRWIGLAPLLDNERFDMASSDYVEYRRILDMRDGTLSREVTWTTSKGRQIRLGFERFMSMVDRHICCVKLTAEALNFSGKLELEADLDSSLVHELTGKKCYWKGLESKLHANVGLLHVITKTTNLEVVGAMVLTANGKPVAPTKTVADELKITQRYEMELRQGTPVTVDKIVATASTVDRIGEATKLADYTHSSLKEALGQGYDCLLETNREYWSNYWQQNDVIIEPDESTQQGIRYCLFQMGQTYCGGNPWINIGAKALSGEWHMGWYFWDTEMYMLPLYLLTNPEAARDLMMYRYNTLDQARSDAKALRYKGAKYPWITIKGTECCPMWWYGMLELHINIAVQYGVWHYYCTTRDKDFLFDYGLEILIETSRFWADRATWNEHRKQYSINYVMGPDEYRIGADNNAYTNSMVSLTMKITLDVVDMVQQEAPQKFQRLSQRIGLNPAELKTWSHMRDNMFVPTDTHLGIICQDETFLNAERMLAEDIPADNRVIDDYWNLERVHRCSLLKQADVLLLLFLCPELVDSAGLRRNYEFYEPMTLHASSLSPCIHSIIASKVGLKEGAWKYFMMTARLDLDDRLNKTELGLHTANLSGAWMCLTYGFAGMETIGDVLSFRPILPAKWRSYSFRISYRGSHFELAVADGKVILRRLAGRAHTVRIFGKEYTTDNEVQVKLRPLGVT